MLPHPHRPAGLGHSIGSTQRDTHNQIMHVLVPPDWVGEVADLVLIYMAAVEVGVGNKVFER